MPRDTKFNQAWLERTDSSGNQLHKWLTQGKTDTKFQCTLCKTGDLECSNQVWSAIQQHMKAKSHIKNMKALRNNSKFVLEQSKSQSSSSNGITQNNLLRLSDIRKSTTLTSDEQIAKAETMWASFVYAFVIYLWFYVVFIKILLNSC